MYHFSKVLLVDDDEATNFLAAMAIKSLDIADEIEVAGDGLVAYEWIKQNNCPDIIFLDIRMPRMDGFDFLDNLKEINVCNKAKIVMLTSSTRLEDKQKALSYKSVIEYFEKPLTEEMIQKIADTHF
ncbi:response regulator [Niastella caeni]|uniref:Response regulator n=1 Tax=Niastella caeni TaxID=2569763 RepID=A0A4S8HK06_9BACT|nr:response regulator [Niastella caeni]THU34034.1 response regulator [Niastella caeni]